MLSYKLLTILGAILFIIYIKLKKMYTYWERKGVKGSKPNWLIGNVLPILREKETVNSLMTKMCEMYPNEKAVGMYIGVAPVLLLKDPNLIKKVLIKDFASFADRGLKLTNEDLLNSMFFEKGDKWKVYRQKIAPIFSTRRMKNILPDIAEHTDQFLNYVESLPPGPKELRELDHKLSVRITMSFLFGLTVDSFNRKVDAQIVADELLEFPARVALAMFLYGLNSKLPSTFGLRLLPKNFKEKFVERNKLAIKDELLEDETVFDLMVKLKEQDVFKKYNKDGIIDIEISDSVLASHIAVFLGAGVESYTNSSYLLFMLALNQDMQERCFREIEQILEKYNGNLTLEAISKLQYVNMALDESLRMYPNIGALFRVATKDYHFEDINVTIEKGTGIIIPVMALHYDPKRFPEPEIFNPERFSPENKVKMQDFSYLPFGDGPRKCIGIRLTRLQSALLIAKFLHRFKVTPCEKTVPEFRMESFLLSQGPQDGLWVNITKRH